MPKTYDDLTIFEMDSNWRFDRVAEDLKFCLTDNPNVPFSPYNLASAAREFGEMGYKNTEVMPYWFDKLDAMYGRAVGTEPKIDL